MHFLLNDWSEVTLPDDATDEELLFSMQAAGLPAAAIDAIFDAIRLVDEEILKINAAKKINLN
ncbi:MAG: hypothetical protein ACK5JF_02640 [Oscillospiraceae bacterium]